MIYPVILAGGEGSRFWPLSTPELPKQFLTLIDDRRTMIGLTIDRFRKFGYKSIWIVSHQKYKSLLHKHAFQVQSSHWLLEPMMRNTAPSIAWAAATLFRKDKDAIMISSHSDHWIENEKRFHEDISRAVTFVKKNKKALVTFGIKPTAPETGYGYIESKIDGKISPVKRFVEKPNIKRAKQMLRSSSFFWNSGIFVWRAETILQEIKRYLPSVYESFCGTSSIDKIYKNLSAISIDHGIMEKSKNVHVIKASFRWSDVGTWKSLREIKKKKSNWISVHANNCYVDAEGKPAALVGVSNLMVIDRPEGLLICHEDHVQSVKEVLKKLREKVNSSE